MHRDEINSAWGYLPFNGGPRVCLGQDFGLMGTSYAVVRILQTFPVIEAGQFERPQSQTWQERQKMTLVMSARDGCPIKLA